MSKKRWLGRSLAAVCLALLLGAGAWIFVNRDDLAAFVPMPAGAYAKFLASALFVEGRTEEQARQWARLPLPVGAVTIDWNAKRVTVEAYFQKASAHWVDDKHGVVLD